MINCYESGVSTALTFFNTLSFKNLSGMSVTKALFGRRRRASLREALLAVVGARPPRATTM